MSDHVPSALVGHVVVGIVWFVFLGSLLISLGDRGAFWAGVYSWGAVAVLVGVLAGLGRRLWVFGLEGAWLAVWALVTALSLR